MWRVLAGITAGLTIALALVVGVFVPAADAQERLTVSSTTTYRVDVENNQVLVEASYKLTHAIAPVDLGDGRMQHRYFNQFGVAIPNSAQNYAASLDGVPARTTFDVQESYTYAVSQLVPDIRIGDTRTLTVSYVIPSSGPRSDWGYAEINDDFISLTVWAQGSPGQTTVNVVLPADFQVDLTGSIDAFVEHHRDGEIILIAHRLADPTEFNGQILAHNTDVRPVNTSLTLHSGTGVVLSRPSDPEWRDFVVDSLQNDLPLLENLIGIPWPHGNIVVEQSAEPRIDGFGGWFQSRDNTIKMETANRETLLHEFSHGWFNGDYTVDRWVNEGLAEEFASRVIEATGDLRPDPTWPDPANGVRVPLGRWTQPQTVTTDAQRVAERYHYNASWWVFRQLTDEIGVDALSDVLVEYNDLRSNSDRTWETLFEIIDHRTDADDQNLDALFGTYVAGFGLETMQQRRATLARYDNVFAATDLAAPMVLDNSMAVWDWQQANLFLDDVTALLPRLEEIEARAAALSIDASDHSDRFEDAETRSDLQQLDTLITYDIEALDQLDADRVEIQAAANDLRVDLQFDELVLHRAEQDVNVQRLTIGRITVGRLSLTETAAGAGLSLSFGASATTDDAERDLGTMQTRLDLYLTRRAALDERIDQLGIDVPAVVVPVRLEVARGTMDEQESILNMMMTVQASSAEPNADTHSGPIDKGVVMAMLEAHAASEADSLEPAAASQPLPGSVASVEPLDTGGNGLMPFVLGAVVLLGAAVAAVAVRQSRRLTIADLHRDA